MEPKSGSDERHERLRAEVARNPFISDEDLAERLGVSIHTVRSDRRRLGIPEVRRRGKDLLPDLFGRPRPLTNREVLGDLLEVSADREGLSLLETTEEMGLETSRVIRGHVLFAQANTLANAVVDTEIALTAEAKVEYLAPAHVGERILAKARVLRVRRHARTVDVVLKTPKGAVFHGLFTIHGLTRGAAEHLKIIHTKEGEGA